MDIEEAKAKLAAAASTYDEARRAWQEARGILEQATLAAYGVELGGYVWLTEKNRPAVVRSVGSLHDSRPWLDVQVLTKSGVPSKVVQWVGDRWRAITPEELTAHGLTL